MKKTIPVVITLLTALLLSSCDKDDDVDGASDERLPLYEIIAETKIAEPLCLAKSGDNLILVGKASFDEAYIYAFNSSGELLSESSVRHTSYIINAADVDSAGNIWFFFDKALLACYDTDATLLKSIELDISSISADAPLVSCNRLAADERGFFFASSYDLPTDSQLPYYTFDHDGKLMAQTIFQGDVGDIFGDGELFSFTDKGIFGNADETGENALLVDWFFYDIASPVSGYAATFDENFIYALKRNSANGKTIDLIKLTLVDMSNPVYAQNSKKALTAAGFYILDSTIREQINNFNSLNTEYRIELIDYFEDSFDDALQKFNLDIIAGKVPDIVLFNDLLPIPRDSYANKGLFVNLYELMENDPDVSAEDYLPNILKALEIDGKLFYGATSFYVSSLVGKSSVVGSDMGWTWEEFYAIADKQPQGTVLFAEPGVTLTKEIMLRILLTSKLNDYIDTKTTACDFINSDFIELLEMVNDTEESVFISSSNYSFSAGNPLLMSVTMFDFFNLREWETVLFQDEVTFIGFPSNDGQTTGAYAKMYNTFALSAQSENLDGAWEFAKFLMVECQKNVGRSGRLPDGSFKSGFDGFPIRKTELYNLAEDSRHRKNTIVDLNGDEPVPVTTELSYNTDAEINKILDLINSISVATTNERYAHDIIFEETEWFFAGQKTVQQVAQIIQDRVSTYLSEQS